MKKANLLSLSLKRVLLEKVRYIRCYAMHKMRGNGAFSKLQGKYQQYTGLETGLIQAHQEAFNLEHTLDAKDLK